MQLGSCIPSLSTKVLWEKGYGTSSITPPRTTGSLLDDTELCMSHNSTDVKFGIGSGSEDGLKTWKREEIMRAISRPSALCMALFLWALLNCDLCTIVLQNVVGW